MSDMVEKVARAIYDANDPTSNDPLAVLMHAYNPFIDDSRPIPEQLEQVMDICRSAARAAIEAMRKPSELMLDFGSFAFHTLDRDNDGSREFAIDIWQAMIDAALAEQKAPA